MLGPWLLFALTVVRTPTDGARDVLKGAALYHACQAEVRLMDLPSLTAGKEPDLIDGAFCAGFINGFTGMEAESKTVSTIAICTHGASTGTVVRTYVHYMENHLQLMEQDRRLGLRLALEEAYPCPAAGKLPGGAPPSAPSRKA